MQLTDKTGKVLEVNQLVDFHMLQIATGLVIDVKHNPISVPGQGRLPACVTIQCTLTIPAGPEGGIWCYVVKDAPPKKQMDDLLDGRELGGEVESNIVKMKVH